jgi:hypothetical protein
MRARGSRWFVVVVFGLTLMSAAPARAWNPLAPIEAVTKKIGSTVGSLLGLGGLVESTTTPTIKDLQSAGSALLTQTDTLISTQLANAHAVTSDLISQTDKAVGSAISQVDQSVQARIVQTQAVGDELVDRSVGEVNAAAQARIAQAVTGGKQLVTMIGSNAQVLLAQGDAILTTHIEQLDQVVSSSIQQADQVAAARIAQVDEAAGRRIGNVDTIATKQSLGLEQILLRLATLVAFVIFCAFVLWRLFVEVGGKWPTEHGEHKLAHAPRALAASAPRLVPQLLLAMAGAGLLALLAYELPRNTEKRVEQQLAQHTKAMGDALAAYDFTTVRYETSQLAILDTGSAEYYDKLDRKAQVLRDVLTRPALLQSPAGVRQVTTEINLVDPTTPVTTDPDMLALEGFVQWQVGTSRRDELAAAQLCAQSLATGSNGLLAPLARNYVRMFLHDPYTPDAYATAQDLATLQAALPGSDATASSQFEQVIAYDALAAQLDTASTNAYLAMLDAQVDYDVAANTNAKADALARRTKHATAVVAAWQAFDQGLQTAPALAGDPTALAAFTLDDVVLSHALYELNPTVKDATALPPALVAEPGAASGSASGSAAHPAKAPPALTPAQRVAIAPIRVAWARRYASLLSPDAQDVLAFEETQRFADFERRIAAFEAAYVKLGIAMRGSPGADLGKLANDAIVAAADLELYRGVGAARAALATTLMKQVQSAGGVDLAPSLAQTVADDYQVRRMRFL